jgi:hypothetical protein
MDELIHELEKHFSFGLVVDFRELNKRVVTDPYPLPRPRGTASRIGMEKKKDSLGFQIWLCIYGLL